MILHNYNRDVTSAITLDTSTMVSDMDLKSWGFLVYPHNNEEQENSFGDLMKQILLSGVMPFARHFFQGYLTHHGTLPKVYC